MANKNDDELLDDELNDELESDETLEEGDESDENLGGDNSEPEADDSQENESAEGDDELTDESNPEDENIFYVHKIFAITQGNTYTAFEANQKVDVNKFTGDDRKVIDALIKDGSLKRTPYTR